MSNATPNATSKQALTCLCSKGLRLLSPWPTDAIPRQRPRARPHPAALHNTATPGPHPTRHGTAAHLTLRHTGPYHVIPRFLELLGEAYLDLTTILNRKQLVCVRNAMRARACECGCVRTARSARDSFKVSVGDHGRIACNLAFLRRASKHTNFHREPCAEGLPIFGGHVV